MKKFIFGLLAFIMMTPFVYAEETDIYNEIFNEIAPNGVLEMNSIKPSNEEELFGYLYMYSVKNNYSFSINNCDANYSKCTIYLDVYEIPDIEYIEGERIKQKDVKVTWKETNPQVKALVDGYISKIKNNKSSLVTDLELINLKYAQHVTKNYTGDINYISKFKTLYDNNSHISIDSVGNRGDVGNFGGMSGNFLSVMYDGILYGILDDYTINFANIIYIPDETPNTSEAYIQAAQKRIDEYLGNSDVKIKKGGYLKEIEPDGFNYKPEMGEYYYYVAFGNAIERFIISRDSSKIETPVINTTDTNTNITISTDSNIPSDTKVQVTEIAKESDSFAKIKDVLKITDNEEVQIYDIKLFSDSENKYITKLDNGEFKISVPINENLRNKKLAAYYITDNNEIEKHSITVENGIGAFTTNHFSIYTIAEDRESEDVLTEAVPKTYDGIINYFIIGVIGIVGLISASVVVKKKAN